MLNTNYQLEFSESYSGNLHGATLSENIPYVMSLHCALQSLLQENYNSFLLTIGSNTISIYTIPNGLLKIFDSHARDSFGMAHSHGTCVLLEVNSINNLVEYFQNLYQPDVLFELKGIKITVTQFTQVSNMDTCSNTSQSSHCSSRSDNQTSNENFNSGQCCAMCYYCICFSTITACNYWNDLTLTAIAEHAMLHYQEALKDGNEFICDYLPQIVDICGAAVDVVFGSRYQDILSFTSVSSKHVLESLILENTSENTGFLLQLSNYWLGCIF